MTQTRRRKPLSQAVEKNLKEKAKKTRFTYGQLAQVYRRGQGLAEGEGQERLMLIYLKRHPKKGSQWLNQQL